MVTQNLFWHLSETILRPQLEIFPWIMNDQNLISFDVRSVKVSDK